MAHNLYNESDSMDSSDLNQESYNNILANDRKKTGYGLDMQKKMAATNKYDISKVKNSMFDNFGNSMGGGGFGNFGKTAQFGNMLGPFSNTGGLGNDIYNINLDFDKDKYKEEDKKKKEIGEDKKIIRESTESKNENKFMKDIEDEIGLESSVNKTPYGSKIDFTEQSQKNSKILKDDNKDKNKIKEDSEEKEKDKEEELEVEEEIEDKKNQIAELKEKEKEKESQEEKQKKMEEYMKAHQPKVDW